MPSKKAIIPQYIKWADKEFWADADVRTMDFMSRHFYRALCIAAHYCSTRPYLPSDDNQLWKLADAGTKELWMKHKGEVLSKFVPRKGSAQLAHKRILADWAATDEWYKQQKEKAIKGGRAKAAKSAHGQPTGTGDSAQPLPITEQKTEITETETRLNQITEHEHRTETETRRDSSGSGSGDGGREFEKPSRDSGSDVGLDQEKVKTEARQFFEDEPAASRLAAFLDQETHQTGAYEVVDAWREVYPELECYAPEDDPRGHAEQISRMAEQGESLAAMVMAINWLPKSDYWGREGKGAFKQGLGSFLNAWPAISKACAKWHAAKKATVEAKKARRGK